MNNFVKFDPCPFCNSNMIHFERVDLGNIVSKYHWRVHCRECNASTGLYENQADAYKMWQNAKKNVITKFKCLTPTIFKPSEWNTPDEKWMPESEVSALINAIIDAYMKGEIKWDVKN